MHKYIHQIEEWRQALFVGFFGPIGVSAIFYLYISLEYLHISVVEHGQEREDAVRLGETMTIVIWFLVICSIVDSTPTPFIESVINHCYRSSMASPSLSANSAFIFHARSLKPCPPMPNHPSRYSQGIRLASPMFDASVEV
jgi:hypothetical protein